MKVGNSNLINDNLKIGKLDKFDNWGWKTEGSVQTIRKYYSNEWIIEKYLKF